jgi:hypothetical protein
MSTMKKSFALLKSQFYGQKDEETLTVDSRDHELHYLMHQAVLNPSLENTSAVQKELNHRDFVDGLFAENFTIVANAPEIPQNLDCLRMFVGEVEEMCGPWSAYSLKYVRKIANVCDTMTEEEIADLVAKVYTHCN